MKHENPETDGMATETTPQKKLPLRRRRGGTRKKTGCYTCKARHTRCDENKPTCGNCERLGLECRASEFIMRSAWSQVNSSTEPQIPSVEPHGPADPVGPPTSTWDIFHAGVPEWSSPSNMSSQSPTDLTSSSSPAVAPERRPNLLLTPEMVFLLNEYRKGLATWMDIFDHGGTYQREIARHALTSELLLTCICAFTARHLGFTETGTSWGPIATDYYAQALNLLIAHLNSSVAQDDTLSAVILLSSYEVLANQGQEYRRHYEGATKLIHTYGVSAQSIGVDRANFWIWIRHEVTVCITHEVPLQVRPELWNVAWRETETDEDALGNQILYHVGRAIECLHSSHGSWFDFFDVLRDAEHWYTGLSEPFRGIRFGDVMEEGLQKVYFAVPAAAAAMIWYHTLHVLVYAHADLRDEYAQNVEDHAVEIIRISISDIPNQVRCFSIVPLYVAGKHIKRITMKTRVLILLDKIQTELGYHTRSRVEALQKIIMAM